MGDVTNSIQSLKKTSPVVTQGREGGGSVWTQKFIFEEREDRTFRVNGSKVSLHATPHPSF